MITNWMKFEKFFNAGEWTMSSQKLVLSGQIVGFVVVLHDSLQITFFCFLTSGSFRNFPRLYDMIGGFL